MIPENEEKKNYLMRYKWAERAVREIEEEIVSHRLNALPRAVTYDGMPKGIGGSSDMSGYAAKLDSLIIKLTRQRDRMLDECRAISEAIAMIDDPKLETVLRYRYIQNRSWRSIAGTMGYSEYYVKRDLHSQALAAFKIPEN